MGGRLGDSDSPCRCWRCVGPGRRGFGLPDGHWHGRSVRFRPGAGGPVAEGLDELEAALGLGEVQGGAALAVVGVGVGSGAQEVAQEVWRLVVEDREVQRGVARGRVGGGKARPDVEAGGGEEEAQEVALAGPDCGGQRALGAVGGSGGGGGGGGGRGGRSGLEGVGLLVVGGEDLGQVEVSDGAGEVDGGPPVAVRGRGPVPLGDQQAGYGRAALEHGAEVQRGVEVGSVAHGEAVAHGRQDGLHNLQAARADRAHHDARRPDSGFVGDDALVRRGLFGNLSWSRRPGHGLRRFGIPCVQHI